MQTAALEPSSSIILPTVIREGKPCGFMMRSGTSPRSVKGMSDCRVGGSGTAGARVEASRCGQAAGCAAGIAPG